VSRCSVCRRQNEKEKLLAYLRFVKLRVRSLASTNRLKGGGIPSKQQCEDTGFHSMYRKSDDAILLLINLCTGQWSMDKCPRRSGLAAKVQCDRQR